MATQTLPEALQSKQTIPIETIIEYKLQGLKESDIGTLLNCTQQNISARLKEYRKEIQGVETFKKNRAELLAVIQSKILNSLSVADIKKATAYQKVGMFALLYDKERLERDKSTAIITYEPGALRERYNALRAMLDDAIDVPHKVADKGDNGGGIEYKPPDQGDNARWNG